MLSIVRAYSSSPAANPAWNAPYRWAMVLLSCLLLTGCVEESASLHTDDHELPAHWPTDMADAADKIEERLVALESEGVSPSSIGDLDLIRRELAELVEWVPVIAADTDLTEGQWKPIYDYSETIRRQMAAKDVSVQSCREDFEQLTKLLRSSHSQFTSTITEGNPELGQ